MRSREAAALAAATFLISITVAWWALALWPATASATWLARTREVCFGAAPGGLPDAAGWVALVLQPTIMFGVLFALWGEALEHPPATEALEAMHQATAVHADLLTNLLGG